MTRKLSSVMSIVSLVISSWSIKSRAFILVRWVVPNPGIVIPWIVRLETPSMSQVLTATSSARVESSPPEIPRFSGVPAGSCSTRFARPAHWIPKISAQRPCSSLPSLGTNGVPEIVRANPVMSRVSRNGILRNGERYLRQSSKLVVDRRSVWSFSISTSRLRK